MNHKLKTVIGGGRRWVSAMALTVMVVAGMTSCDFGGGNTARQTGLNRPMGVSAMGVESTTTRATAITMNELDSIGVYGYYTRDERWIWETFNEPDSLLANRFCNLKLRKSNGWTYSPLQYWPIDPRYKISFFAYAPAIDQKAIDEGRAKYFPFPLDDHTPSIPLVSYDLDTIITKQIDLLWSACLDRTWQDNNGVVNFQMHHSLAGIKFSAELRDAGELAKGYTCRIMSVGIYSVHGRGDLRLDNGKWIFKDDETNWYGNYTMELIDGNPTASRLVDIDITGRNGIPWDPTQPAGTMTGDTLAHQLLTPASGILMVMPQEFTKHSMFIAMLEFKRETANGQSTLIVPYPVLLKDIKNQSGYVQPWTAGEIIEYRFVISDEFISIRTMAYPWNSADDSESVVIL